MKVNPTSRLSDLIESKRTIVTLGPGGVGKTTISAAIAIESAYKGRNVAVVTIDPAKRLAGALGLKSLSNTPTPIVLGTHAKGTLHALMLDVQETFEQMVKNYASSQEQIDEILANKIYQNLTQSLSGTQEYMAMERLWELHNDKRFDLIVVDTPPSVGALDFLEAPKRLVSFLDNRVFQLLIKPVPLYLRPLSVATRTLLKTISKVVGSEVVADAVEFFRAFSGIEEGFKVRAKEIGDLIGSQSTGFIGVTSPQSLALTETVELIRRLSETDISIDAVLVNRVTPQFLGSEEHLELASDSVALSASLVTLLNNSDQIAKTREHELRRLEKHRAGFNSAPYLLLENQGQEVATSSALKRLGNELFVQKLATPDP